MEFIAKNAYLSLEEMHVNAYYIYSFFSSLGWSLEAISGMLGNMQTESTINSGIWQSLTVNYNRGYGLVQWTPATKITTWLSSNGYSMIDMYGQCARIEYERLNGLQYYQTSTYPLSFTEYSQSIETPEYLAYAFINNYERPDNVVQPVRQEQARYWYEYLGGTTPVPPTPPTPIYTNNKLKLIYYTKIF